jgi:NTE family protein
MSVSSGSRKQALVLSGGGVKGAYQAGAMAEILQPKYEFRPTAVYGISVGSINGGMLASFVGQQILDGKEPNLTAAAEQLENYWLKDITDLSKIGKRRWVPIILWEVLVRNFHGMINVDKSIKIMRDKIQPENLLRAAGEKGRLKFYAGALNLTTGEYFNAPYDNKIIIDYVIASCMEPIVMPMWIIPKEGEEKKAWYREKWEGLNDWYGRNFGGLKHEDRLESWLDGGIHNVAPLSDAIDKGYDDIVCVLCRPPKLGHGSFQGDLAAIGERISDVVTQTLLDKDIGLAKRFSELVKTRRLDGLQVKAHDGTSRPYRSVDLTVVRPKTDLEVNIQSLAKGQVPEMVKKGRADAAAVMNGEYAARFGTPRPGSGPARAVTIRPGSEPPQAVTT